MTCDLSHEEERKSEWGKLPLERKRERQSKNEKQGREEKNEEGEEKVSGVG